MKKLLIASATTVLFALPVMGWAHSSNIDGPDHSAYWHDASGEYVKDRNGDCIKTGSWFPGAQVQACMDAVDSDGDGVMDENDHCPDTPKGYPVDELGCALDSDWDGVPDGADHCPNTPSGAEVDKRGCEIAKAAPPAEVVLMEVDLKINFAFDSAQVKGKYHDEINKVADFMKKADDSVAYIEGHTDSTGPAAYNEKLSQERADAVGDILVNEYGIAEDRINTVGYGESRPVADNGTKEGRQANRRVAAVVKGMVEK